MKNKTQETNNTQNGADAKASSACVVSPKYGEYWWVEITKNEIEPVLVNREFTTKKLYCDVIGWDAGISFNEVIRWICKIDKPE